MIILFDINHPVDVNFFRNTIIALKNSGHRIIITFRPRGKLGKIVKYELGDFSPIAIGKHYKSFVKKIIGQLVRDYQMFKFQKRENIDLSVCFGPTNAISSWFNRIPYLAFDDDFEYKIPFYHANIFSTRHIFPQFISFSNSKTHKYNGFKELAYLHPNVFQPSFSELKKYNLAQNKYVFIREIANVSLNYNNLTSNISLIVNHIKNLDFQIVLSLEDDSLKEELEKSCIVLKEPVNDIYSLMKHALFVISSGDTMAREACLLETPCIYTGKRNMYMNKELIEIGAMYKEDHIVGILNRIDYLIKNNIKAQNKLLMGQIIKTKWDNTTSIILKHINYFMK